MYFYLFYIIYSSFLAVYRGSAEPKILYNKILLRFTDWQNSSIAIKRSVTNKSVRFVQARAQSNSNSVLFDPIKLGDLELPNRIVMAPMTRNRADQAGVPRLDMVPEYYKQRASAGLIVSEGAQISQQGQGYPLTPGIYSDDHVNAWKTVTKAVHDAGGRIFCQLWHCGRISDPAFQPGMAYPVAPSAIASNTQVYTYEGPQPPKVPHALTGEEIQGVVRDFKYAAQRAQEANFDGVELHGASGYLIEQFLKDGTNTRDDEYGGSFENRGRFLGELIQAVSEVWGKQRVGVKVSPVYDFNDAIESNPAESYKYFTQLVEKSGLAYIHIQNPRDDLPDSSPLKELNTRYYKQFLKNTLLIGNNGFNTSNSFQRIEKKETDLISYGRLYLSTPDLPARLQKGQRLNKYDRKTFYDAAAGARGLIDYPTYDQIKDESQLI